MRRVMVIGSGGSGKSTFSRQLGRILDLPVVHLDAEFWRPGWERTPEDEWRAKVEELVTRDGWVMDGNFGGTRDVRMRAADTIIFLDIPRFLCLYRAVKRAFIYRGRTRPDMAEGCQERLDLEFLLWIWNYPSRGRLRTIRDLEGTVGKNIIVLKTRKQVKEFLDDQRRHREQPAGDRDHDGQIATRYRGDS